MMHNLIDKTLSKFDGPDEYLLNHDVDVALWIDFWTHRGETPLREVCRNDFVVITNELHQDFDDFKKEQSIDLQQRRIVPLNELIEVYYALNRPIVRHFKGGCKGIHNYVRNG